jgi:hypothetical protein
MMLNPLMVLRSQQMIERYMPVVQDMAAGKDVSLTEGDLAEIDGFLNEFASKGSPQLKQTVKGLCDDLRNRDVHKEFGITVTPGPRRELPARPPFLSTNHLGLGGMLAGACAILVFGLTGKRGTFIKKNGKQISIVMLAMAVVGGQWSGVGDRGPGVGGQNARTISNEETTTNSPLIEPSAPGSHQPELNKAFNRLPIRFEANNGQADPEVKFISRGPNYSLSLTPDEATLTLATRRGEDAQMRRFSVAAFSASPTPGRVNRPGVPASPIISAPQGLASNSVLRMKLKGANPDPRITGLDELPTKTNYFIGKDRSNWRADVPSYAKVKYEMFTKAWIWSTTAMAVSLNTTSLSLPALTPIRSGLISTGLKAWK